MSADVASLMVPERQGREPAASWDGDSYITGPHTARGRTSSARAWALPAETLVWMVRKNLVTNLWLVEWSLVTHVWLVRWGLVTHVWMVR